MSIRAQQYAEALYRAAHATDTAVHDALVDRFLALVRERGHTGLLPTILREYEAIVHERSTGEEVHLRVAHASDRERYAERIAGDVRTLSAEGQRVHTVVDESAIGGYAVEANGTRIDRTYKHALLELYSSITNA